MEINKNIKYYVDLSIEKSFTIFNSLNPWKKI